MPRSMQYRALYVAVLRARLSTVHTTTNRQLVKEESAARKAYRFVGEWLDRVVREVLPVLEREAVAATFGLALADTPLTVGAMCANRRLTIEGVARITRRGLIRLAEMLQAHAARDPKRLSPVSGLLSYRRAVARVLER